LFELAGVSPSGYTIFMASNDYQFITPIKNGEVVKPEEFMALDEADRQSMERTIGELQDKLQKVIRQVPQWVREGRNRPSRVQPGWPKQWGIL
jgi:hypothetical protein